MKILIAEDDITSRTILEGMLTKWGYQVISACDGEEAYDTLWGDSTLQLAILDWEMPGMDGATLCRKFRTQRWAEPLYMIMLTGRSEKKDIVQGLKAGADDYIPKPCNPTELHARLEVGRRMILMQNRMRAQERLQGVLEMAGAAFGQLAQPLQSVKDMSGMLLGRTDRDGPDYEPLKHISEEIGRIDRLIQKIININHEDLEPYMKKGQRN